MVWRMAVGGGAGALGLLLIVAHLHADDDASSFAPSQAVLLKLTATGDLDLSVLDPAQPVPGRAPAGVVVWKSATGRERWAALSEGGAWPADEGAPETAGLPGAATRGGDTRALGAASAGAVLASTIQLEPLEGTTLTRGAAFVSPRDNSEVLSSRPTVRRPAEKGKLPPRTAIITPRNSDKVLLRIPFREGQADVSLAEFAGWPSELKAGLPPGEYSLRFEQGVENNRFTVLDGQQRRRYWNPIESMRRLAGQDDPVAVQFAVEHLLNFLNDDDSPRFLADALDLLESFPSGKLTMPQQRTRTLLRDWLDKLSVDPGYRQGRVAASAPGTQTGIERIDAARQAIAAGHWSQALEELDPIRADGDGADARRQRGLKALYRGVVLAEAGVGQADAAIEQFSTALELLSGLENTPAGPVDLLRAYNNFANFRLLLAQNGLGNHAFQMAAGIDQPVSDCLLNLVDAREKYTAALDVATRLKDRGSQDAIRVNLARVYSLMADLIRTLDVPAPGKPRGFLAGEQAATAMADKFAAAVTDAKAADAEPQTVSAGWELRSQLAYRRGDWAAAATLAGTARAGFAGQGDLAGVETSERLLGLTALATGERAKALTHFSIAQLLAELQRARFPQDQTGQARAGYFARHSFIYEKLVELHLAEGRPREALRYAELMKARAAQDLLTALGVADQEESAEPRDLEELLGDWPADTAAVEYFLGAEQGWGFVIRSGEVRAFALRDEDGTPVATRTLLTSVRQYLSDVEGQSHKMMRRMLAGRGFDSTWQDRLYSFRRVLLPDDVLGELRQSRLVVLVPQHILHYFPFAALVTERDAKPRDKSEMVQPRFVIDEAFNLVSSPSLTTWDLIRRRRHAPLSQVKAVGLVEAPGAPPLPGVTQDLENLRAVFGARLKQVVEAGEALEQRAKGLLGEPGMLMFATHGFNDPDHPAESYLLFLGDDAPVSDDANSAELLSADLDDGRLTAREIFAQRVNARLIVMSACYSGLGDRSPQPGDDLFGLQRAFLHAGARSVLSGLWDVYDGTAPDLIRKFHEGVAAGKSPPEALAQSQREFLNKLRASDSVEPWLHPYFWSVFCVAGAE